MANEFELFTSLRYDPILSEDVVDIGDSDCHSFGQFPGPFYMLPYHRDRLLRAATHWKWTKAVTSIEGPEGLERLEAFLHDALGPGAVDTEPTSDARRVKVLLSREGQIRVESSKVPGTQLANLFPNQLPTPEQMAGNPQLQTPLGQLKIEALYDVYVDGINTPRSEYTHYKTTRREMYDGARHRAGLKSTDATKEVLIVNQTTGSVMEGSLTTPYFWRGGQWVTPPVSHGFSQEDGSGGQDGTTRRWALEKKRAVEEDVKASSVAHGELVWLSNGVRGFVAGRVQSPQSWI